ncbi:MAG: cupin domain-containing protein [Bacteroidales bacterium]|nr:cupin domain-containing protein [Bacteroidales bacterium]
MQAPVNLFKNSDWQDALEYPNGTKKRVLRDENGAKTILLKLPEGFYMAPHAHVTAEQHILMQGEYISEGKKYHAGTYQKFEAHENHGPFESKHGALVLVVWDPYQPNK